MLESYIKKVPCVHRLLYQFHSPCLSVEEESNDVIQYETFVGDGIGKYNPLQRFTTLKRYNTKHIIVVGAPVKHFEALVEEEEQFYDEGAAYILVQPPLRTLNRSMLTQSKRSMEKSCDSRGIFYQRK